MIKKEIIPFAGYPIYLVKSDFILNNDELNFIRNLNYRLHHQIKNLKLSINMDILKLNELKRLKNFIRENLDNYINDVWEIKNKFYFCQSWSTIQSKGAHHPMHSHPNHIISSVYYVKTEKTNLMFSVEKDKISENFHFEYEIKNSNYFNSKLCTVDVEPGSIVFFPGSLNHGSTINTEEERITVPSSFFVDGKIGSKYNYTNNIDITNSNKY